MHSQFHVISADYVSHEHGLHDFFDFFSNRYTGDPGYSHVGSSFKPVFWDKGPKGSDQCQVT